MPRLSSLAFIVAVLAWLRAAQLAETEKQRSELVSDAPTLQEQIDGVIERKAAALAAFASQVESRGRDAQGLAAARRCSRACGGSGSS